MKYHIRNDGALIILDRICCIHAKKNDDDDQYSLWAITDAGNPLLIDSGYGTEEDALHQIRTLRDYMIMNY